MIMQKSSTSLGNSGAYTSPGTPEYGDNYTGGIPKGWRSERVPLPAIGGRRHISAAALTPFNSGRALPSKWDDAERWITSPVSGYGVCKTSNVQPQRRPQSKSGPLGTSALMYLPNCSPTVPVLDAGSRKNLMAGSPFTAGVLVPDGLSIHYGVVDDAKSNSYAENTVTQYSSLPGLSDLLSEPSIPSSQDDKHGGSKEAESSVSRRDMATQMSPDDSTNSSLNGRSSFSAFPTSTPTAGLYSSCSAKIEVRDVQVDNTVTRFSMKHVARRTKKGSSDAKDSALPWDVANAAKNTSKLQREEAKITAWENFQKAKAETAIRKLEMKLEKRRSASMDKILNKLRAAQFKAEKMRNSMTQNQVRQSTTRTSPKAFFCKYAKTGSLISCFFSCT